MISSKYSLEYNAICYNPVSRKQIYDFLILGDINKRIEQLREEDVRKKKEHHKALKYFRKKESLYRDLNNKQISEIVKLYKNFLLLRLKPTKIHECLNKFRSYKFRTDLIDEESDLQEYQIIDDFISIQATTMDDLFEEDIAASSQVVLSYYDYDNALLLLKRFSEYRQEIISVQLIEEPISEQLSTLLENSSVIDFPSVDLPFMKDYRSENKNSIKDRVDTIVLSIAFKANNIQIFNVDLEMEIQSQNQGFVLNDYIIKYNNDFGNELFRKFIVKKVNFEIEIPLYPADIFELNLYNKENSKLLFYSQIVEPFPVTFYRSPFNLQFQFNDAAGNECKLAIYNPLVLEKRNDSWLSKILKSEFIPDGIIPMNKYIIDALQKFDFSGISYLSDIGGIHKNQEIQSLLSCNNEKACFFVSGIDSHERNYDKLKIFRIEIDFRSQTSTIDFHKFYYHYFDR